MTECRPPEGTPDGTVCNLKHKNGGKLFQCRWKGGRWRKPFYGTFTPELMEKSGYRFHSLVTPPQEPTP